MVIAMPPSPVSPPIRPLATPTPNSAETPPLVSLTAGRNRPYTSPPQNAAARNSARMIQSMCRPSIAARTGRNAGEAIFLNRFVDPEIDGHFDQIGLPCELLHEIDLGGIFLQPREHDFEA